jgi:hypothetical protein
MEPSLYHIVPAIGVALVLCTLLPALFRTGALTSGWKLAAVYCALFAGWSAHAVASGGLTGFWAEHIRNAWSNQIWLDLLAAASLAFLLLLPRARAIGMKPAPWLALVLATGSIGLLAMAARLLWLEAAAKKPAA